MKIVRSKTFSVLNQVNDERIPQGKGCLVFPGNDAQERQFFDGFFKDKMAHGVGVMRWRDGEVYEGQFESGLRQGTGTYTSKVKYKFREPLNLGSPWPSGHGIRLGI